MEDQILFLGCPFVGKTSVITRKLYKKFVPCPPTINMGDRISLTVNGVDLYIQDTAGQERYNSLTRMHFRNAAAAVFVFDITKLDTFEKIDEMVRNVLGETPGCKLYLVGNKLDLETSRAVTNDMALEKAEKLEMMYAETSALQDVGVDDLFATIAENYVKYKKEKKKKINNGGVNIAENKNNGGESGGDGCGC